MKILLVEDDARVASFIRRGLKEENYTVDSAGDGEDALFKAQTGEYDLIILDLMLPKKNGLEVLRELRKGGGTVPVLILTAKDDKQDKGTGLDAADLDVAALPHRVQRKGKEITLTSREFALLELFLRNPSRVVTRTMLAEHVWEHDFDPMSNVIDVYVARVRNKVDEGFSLKLIQTVRGRGYMLEVPEE